MGRSPTDQGGAHRTFPAPPGKLAIVSEAGSQDFWEASGFPNTPLVFFFSEFFFLKKG
jgi:hypothetical protein